MPYELAVVIPVHNEAETIAVVLHSWQEELSALGIDFRIIVVNDGSTDATASILSSFAPYPWLEVVEQPNQGHGPAILAGYRRALADSEWVFQVDGDNEMRSLNFPDFWLHRGRYDALFGYRAGCPRSLQRQFISAFSRRVIQICFGRAVKDVNVPYRLIRTRLLEDILPRMPRQAVAPNILIAGAIARKGVRVTNLTVPHFPRHVESRGGSSRWFWWKLAAKAFWQTLSYRFGLSAHDQ